MRLNKILFITASLIASGVTAVPPNWWVDPSLSLIRSFESSLATNTDLQKQYQDTHIGTAGPTTWKHSTFNLLYVVLGDEQYLQENTCRRIATNELPKEKYNLNCKEIYEKGNWVEAKSIADVKYIEMVWAVDEGTLGTVTIRSNPIRSNYEQPVYDPTPRKTEGRHINIDKPDPTGKVFQLDFKDAIEFAKKYDGLKSFGSLALLPRAAKYTPDAQSYYSFQSGVEDEFHISEHHEAVQHDVRTVIGHGTDQKPCFNMICWRYAQVMYDMKIKRWILPAEIIEGLMLKGIAPTVKDFGV